MFRILHSRRECACQFSGGVVSGIRITQFGVSCGCLQTGPQSCRRTESDIRELAAGFASQKSGFRPTTSKPGPNVLGDAPATLRPSLNLVAAPTALRPGLKVVGRKLVFFDANPAASSLSDLAPNPHRAHSIQTGLTPSVRDMAPPRAWHLANR